MNYDEHVYEWMLFCFHWIYVWLCVLVCFRFLSILLQHYMYVYVHGARCLDVWCMVASSSPVRGSGMLHLSVKVKRMISCVDGMFLSIPLNNNFLLSTMFPKNRGFAQSVDQNICVFNFSCVNGYFSIWEDLEYEGFYFKFMSTFLIINHRHSNVW